MREGMRTGIAARGLALVALASGLALAGCASAPPSPAPAPRRQLPPTYDVAQRERDYLLPPPAGYSQRIDPGPEDALARGHRALLEEGSVEAARRAAEEVLAADSLSLPAQVLAGEA